MRPNSIRVAGSQFTTGYNVSGRFGFCRQRLTSLVAKNDRILARCYRRKFREGGLPGTEYSWKRHLRRGHRYRLVTAIKHAARRTGMREVQPDVAYNQPLALETSTNVRMSVQYPKSMPDHAAHLLL